MTPRGRNAATSGHLWWRQGIEARATARLLELRQRGLWDGKPPVPVEAVLEHLLDIRVTYGETIAERDGEEILAAFCPADREIVVNAAHMDRFETNPGTLNFTLGHEAGHADVYALAAIDQQHVLDGDIAPLAAAYTPQHRSTLAGRDVAALPRLIAEIAGHLPREQKSAVYRRLHDERRARQAAGEDTDLERRTVDTYATALLMPEDIVRRYAEGRVLTEYRALRDLAGRFAVSSTAMKIRVCELGLAYEGPEGRLQLENPAHAGQTELF